MVLENIILKAKEAKPYLIPEQEEKINRHRQPLEKQT